MKVIAIGNSFSQDATRWLHQIAEADGYDLEVTGLYIGGCSLERHWNNVVGDLPDYLWEQNGVSTEKMVTSKEMLLKEKWDVVTLQQVSNNSGLYETFQPYLKNMEAFVRENAPDAKLWIHETWAYEKNCDLDGFKNYDCDQKKMYAALKEAYAKAAVDANAAGIIPSGDVVQELRDTLPEFDFDNGGQSLNRDGYHLTHLYGRYAAAATWFRKLTGRTVSGNTFLPEFEGEVADAAWIAKIQAVVDRMV